VEPATESLTNMTHGRLTPEMLAGLRARLAGRHRGFGLKTPTKAN
jgi:hypothetical protein